MYVRRYRDLFDDSQITAPLKTDVGNGTVVESGTSIVLTAPAATDCRWAAALVAGPVAYLEDKMSSFPEGGLPENHRPGLLRWETRLIGATFTPVDDAPRTGLLVWINRQNAYQLGYDFSSEYVVWQRLVADVETSIADTGGNTVDPNVTPKRLRMYYNPRSRDIAVHGQVISADQIAAFYSEDDGKNWTYLAKENAALDEDFFGAGLYLKRSIAAPTSQAVATFDYLEGADQVEPDPIQHIDETAVYEDVLTFPSAGGPSKHSDSFDRGVGQLIPGPPSQSTGSVGPFDAAAYEDGPMDILTAGGPTQHQMPPDLSTGLVGVGQVIPGPPDQAVNAPVGPIDQASWDDKLTFPAATEELSHSTQLPEGRMMSGTPGQPQGGLIKERRAAWEDRLSYNLGGPNIEYHQNLDDGDGNAFLGGYDAFSVALYKLNVDSWGSPKTPGDGFYGADHSGSLFHNGTPTAFGDFGTTLDGIRKTAWTLSNDEPLSFGDAPDWDITIPADDTLQFAINTSTATGAWAGSNQRWYAEGDFDVEVDFANFAHVGGTDGGAYFVCHVDGNHQAFVRRRGVGTSRLDSDVQLNGSWVNYATLSTAVTSGKFRLERVGSTIRRYYDIGGGWVQQGADQTFGTDRVYFRVGFEPVGTVTTATVQFSNLIKSIGTTVSSKVGWFVEATGTHRGTRDDFPDSALIVSTKNSLDIIDADNNKLWMRFVVGADNVLPTWAASIRPQRVEMREGILLVACSNEAGEGGVIRIDFNLDMINIHRLEASTITGGDYKSTHGSTWYGYFFAQGSIIGRNGGHGYNHDWNNWKLQSYQTQDAALWFDSGFEYRAAAGDGVSLFRWNRWSMWLTEPNGFYNPEWAWSTETARMHWCYFRQSNGELMYMDSTSLYSVLEATYLPRLAGGFAHLWSADVTKALAGTRTYNSQYVAIQYSTNTFFMPANEGIYKIDWPIGIFVHQYGSPASSAAYKILPANTLTTGAVVTDDGGIPLLVVTVYHRDLGANQLFAINLTNHTIYSRSPLITDNLDFRESAA